MGFEIFKKMNIMKYINVPIFIISLAIGLFIVYITMPDMRKIYVYPTPENVDKILFKEQCLKELPFILIKDITIDYDLLPELHQWI